MEICEAARKAGVKHGVVQDKLFLPGLLKLDDAGRCRLLRPDPCRCAASSATGCSKATCSRSQRPVLELPQGRRRRHHPRHAVPLALCARQPVRRREERLVPGRDAHPATLGRAGQAVRGHGRRRRLRHLRATATRATSSPTSTAPGATRVRRDDLVTFHVDGTHGSAVAGLQECRAQPRVNTPKPVWNPDLPQPMNFFDQLAGRARRATLFDNGFKVAVGAVHPPCRRGRAVPLDPSRRRQGRAAGGGRAAELARAPLGGRAGAGRCEDLAMNAQPASCDDGTLAPYTLPARALPRREQARHAIQSRRLFGGARGRRCARRRRPVARLRDRLGHDHSPTACICGASASASPKRWTRRSAAWASTGRRRSSSSGNRSMPRRDVPGRAARQRLRHGSPRARRRRAARRCDPRLRRADGRDRSTGRTADPDGEPRAGAHRHAAPTTTRASTIECCRRRASR